MNRSQTHSSTVRKLSKGLGLILVLLLLISSSMVFADTIRYYRMESNGALMYEIGEQELSFQTQYYEAHFDENNELLFYHIIRQFQESRNPFDVDPYLREQLGELDTAYNTINDSINALVADETNHTQTTGFGHQANIRALEDSQEEYASTKERVQFDRNNLELERAENNFMEAMEHLRQIRDLLAQQADLQNTDNQAYQELAREYQQAKDRVRETRARLYQFQNENLTPWSPEKESQPRRIQSHYFSWDPAHQVRMERIEDEQGNVILYEEITYSTDFKKLSKKQYDKDRRVINQTQYHYSNHLLQREEFFANSGEYRITEYTYNENQLVRVNKIYNQLPISINENANTSNGNTHPAGGITNNNSVKDESFTDIMHYRYGQLRTLERYGQDDRLMLKRKYSESGLFIREEHFDIAGALEEYIEIEYDGNGNRVAEYFYIMPLAFREPKIIQIADHTIEINASNFIHPDKPVMYASNTYLPNEMVTTFYNSDQETNQSRWNIYCNRQVIHDNEMIQLNRIEKINENGHIEHIDYLDSTNTVDATRNFLNLYERNMNRSE